MKWAPRSDIMLWVSFKVSKTPQRAISMGEKLYNILRVELDSPQNPVQIINMPLRWRSKSVLRSNRGLCAQIDSVNPRTYLFYVSHKLSRKVTNIASSCSFDPVHTILWEFLLQTWEIVQLKFPRGFSQNWITFWSYFKRDGDTVNKIDIKQEIFILTLNLKLL